MFLDFIYTEPESRDLQKRGLWYTHPISTIVSRYVELNFVMAPSDMGSIANRVDKHPTGTARSLCDFSADVIQEAQTDLKAGRWHAPCNINRMNGNSPGLF